MPSKLSQTMQSVVDRLRVGDGSIVPKQGGYWLPGEVAENKEDASDREWFDLSLKEFGSHVGTQTIQALADRGYLVAGATGFDKRPVKYSLKVHHLSKE